MIKKIEKKTFFIIGIISVFILSIFSFIHKDKMDFKITDGSLIEKAYADVPAVVAPSDGGGGDGGGCDGGAGDGGCGGGGE